MTHLLSYLRFVPALALLAGFLAAPLPARGGEGGPPAGCGDGTFQPCTAGATPFCEQCDDGNVVPGDGCDAACQIEFCGDGVVNNACSVSCAAPRGICTLAPCLDEQCDDGNNQDGDGCSAVCQEEDSCVAACSSPGARHVSASNAVLVGTSGDDVLCGDDRDNVLRGMAGEDLLCGFDGDDVLYGHQGDDVVDGGGGNDQLRGESGEDLLLGGDGDDALFGHDGADDLDGGNDDDTIRGGGGNDTLEGGAGNDVLNGEGGIDTCTGGETATNCP